MAAPTEPLRDQDRLLPVANVARLMASELPPDAKIAKEAKVLMQEMVSEFICFLTGEANDISIDSSTRRGMAVCTGRGPGSAEGCR